MGDFRSSKVRGIVFGSEDMGTGNQNVVCGHSSRNLVTIEGPQQQEPGDY